MPGARDDERVQAVVAVDELVLPHAGECRHRGAQAESPWIAAPSVSRRTSSLRPSISATVT